MTNEHCFQINNYTNVAYLIALGVKLLGCDNSYIFFMYNVPIQISKHIKYDYII